jgi:hypothetical protein
MAELCGMRCRLQGSKRNCSPCSELNRRPYKVFVDLADLPRGVRDPPSVPDFRSRFGAPYPGADVARSDLECLSTLATDGLRPARSDRVDHGRGIDRVRLSARVASRRIFRPPAWDRPAWDDASDGADQSADLDAALEKDQKNHDGFEHSST